MKLPSVLIFTITYSGKDYCLDEFIKHCDAIKYPNTRHIIIDNTDDKGVYFQKLKAKFRHTDYEVFRTERGNNSREALSRSQNFARRIAKVDDFDYMFSLESDIMCPPNIIGDLMAHAKPVVTGLYHIGDRAKGIRVPCITLKEFNKTIGAFGTRLLKTTEWDEYKNNGLKQVQTGGFGNCLIRREIFEEYAFWYDSRFQGHSDIYFFNDLFQDRVPVFVDTDIICDHQNSKWSDVEDR